mgnify:CR=1 FL=1
MAPSSAVNAAVVASTPKPPSLAIPVALPPVQAARSTPTEVAEAVRPAASFYTNLPLPAPPLVVNIPDVQAAVVEEPSQGPAQELATVKPDDDAKTLPILVYTGQPLRPPTLLVNLPESGAAGTALAGQTETPPQDKASAANMRPVDIAQISDSDLPSLRVPQLHEPGLVPGGQPDLAAKIAAMQVTPLPAVRLPDSERTTLLAEAPTNMTVRIGGTAVGKVDFRMTAERAIDVKLSGLLDVLSQHYDTAEFARLRDSAAADAYVTFDKLRSMGMKVRYDPVYDEIRIDG